MNILKVRDCYGCGVCAIVCSKRIIKINLNKNGFFAPIILEEDKCIDCSLCTDVCAYLHHDICLKGTKIKAYAAWSKDPLVRDKCSSGGAGFEIGKILLEKGYKVCGVRYNPEKGIAEHYISTTVEELTQSIGSKYIQSYTVDGFNAINRKGKYLVVGTPCQIDSFRRYIQKFHIEDNYILMDFFCHGVPSIYLWQKYCKLIEQRIGKIKYVSWRNKLTGWHDSYAMAIDGYPQDEGIRKYNNNMFNNINDFCYFSRSSHGDEFFRLFLGDYCLGKACYNKCKYKYNNSSADIRLGDFWGQTYKNDEKGVNCLVAFTYKGLVVTNSCNCEKTEHPFEIVAEGQMKVSPTVPSTYKIIMFFFRQNNLTLRYIIKIINFFDITRSIINKLRHSVD